MLIVVETHDDEGNTIVLDEALNSVRRRVIKESLEEHKSEAATARALGVARGTLRKYRKLLGV